MNEVTGATELRYLILSVRDEALQNVVWEQEGEFLPFAEAESAIARSVMIRVQEQVSQGVPLQRLFADSAAALLLGEVARLSRDRLGRTPRKAPRGGLAPYQLSRISAYLEDNLSEDITLSELAGLVDLTPHHLCRAFKQSTGLPPHRWQTHRRIERSQELMLMTGMTLTDIASAVGFCDQSHLTTMFRKIVGVTPNAWRRERRL